MKRDGEGGATQREEKGENGDDDDERSVDDGDDELAGEKRSETMAESVGRERAMAMK